jgi:hypothetical protein
MRCDAIVVTGGWDEVAETTWCRWRIHWIGERRATNNTPQDDKHPPAATPNPRRRPQWNHHTKPNVLTGSNDGQILLYHPTKNHFIEKESGRARKAETRDDLTATNSCLLDVYCENVNAPRHDNKAIIGWPLKCGIHKVCRSFIYLVQRVNEILRAAL